MSKDNMTPDAAAEVLAEIFGDFESALYLAAISGDTAEYDRLFAIKNPPPTDEVIEGLIQ